MLGRDRQLSNVERLMILRSFPGFAELSPHDLAALAEYTDKRFFPRGSVLHRAGEPPTVIHFIVEGAAQVNRHGVPQRTMLARETLGAVAWLARDNDTPEVVAVKDTVTLEIHGEDLDDVFEDNFTIFLSVLAAMARNTLQLRAQMGERAGFEEPRDDGVDCPTRALDLVERIFFLRKTLAFAQTRIEALAQLARTAEEVRLAPGAVLWRQGDPPDKILFPICGRVKATTDSGQVFWFHPGSAIGGLDNLARQERWFSAQVDRQLVALRFDTELFLDVLEDHYPMARDFLGILARGLLELFDKRSGDAGRTASGATSAPESAA